MEHAQHEECLSQGVCMKQEPISASAFMGGDPSPEAGSKELDLAHRRASAYLEMIFAKHQCKRVKVDAAPVHRKMGVV